MYTLLYVDDEPALLEVGKLFLERSEQFSVDIVTSAPAALALLDTKTYDAIIADYQMPNMDGIELLKKIRSSGNTIPFILFTGRGREELVIQAFNEGADFYLEKGGEPRSQFADLSNKIRSAVTRRRAEQSLKKSERTLNAMANNIPGVVYRLYADPDGVYGFDYISGRSRQILGLENDPVTFFDRFTEGIIPEDRERLTSMVHHAVSTKTNWVFDGWYVKPSGKKIWISTASQPVIENDRLMFDGVIFDNTGWKMAEAELVRKNEELNASYAQIAAAEEELRGQYDKLSLGEKLLRESEARFRELADLLPQGIYEAEPNGHITYINHLALEMFGYTEEDVEKGLNISSTIAPADRHQVAMTFHRMAEQGTPPGGSRDYHALRKDGSTFPVAIISSPICRDDRITGVRGILMDITDRVKAEEELRATNEQLSASSEELRAQFDELADSEQRIRESEEQFRLIFDLANDAIVLSENGRFTRCNRKTLELFGCTDESEIIGHAVAEFSPEFQPDGMRSSGQVLTRDKRVLKGSPLAFEWVHSRRDGTPFTAEIALNRIDIRGKMFILSIIRDISDRKRAEAAANLARKKLNLMDKVTRHEIRNLITGIIGLVDMAYSMPAGRDREMLNREIKNLIMKIQREMDFTEKYQEIGINLPEWQQVQQLIPCPDSLQVRIAPEIASLELYADPLLAKIFFFLTENVTRHGVHATEIAISARQTPPGMVIIFEDNGVGVPEKKKEAIFTRKEGDRKGMGLFLVREILAITGITITETGEPGKGARFEIVVPPGAFRI
jgi:PAS domain S-box-containing protein